MPAIGKSKAKVYSKTNTAKKKFSDTKGWFEWERKGRGRKKVYTKLFKTRQPGIEAANVRPPKLSFKEARDKARGGGGADKFTFEGKSYYTEQPSKFKKSLREKLTGHKTQKGYEDARDARIKAKRIAKMEKRKEEGKSYSSKNLAELKGSEKKSTYITKNWKKSDNYKKQQERLKTSKKKSYSISS